MATIWIGIALLSLITWIAIEMRKQHIKDKEREDRQNLQDELEQTKDDIEDMNLKETVIDAKTKLKKRTKEVDKKEDKLKKD